MRRALAGLAACVVLLTGCSGDDTAPMLFPDDNQPRESSVEVDTPELRELKAEAGVEDCEPGPGGGALPAVQVACLGGGPAVDGRRSHSFTLNR